MIKKYLVVLTGLLLALSLVVQSETPSHQPRILPEVAKGIALPSDRIDVSNFDAQLLQRLVEEGINEVRAKKKRSTLSEKTTLQRAADEQMRYVVAKNKLMHEQNNRAKKGVRDRVELHNGRFKIVGENLAYIGFLIEKTGKKRAVIPPTYTEAADRLVKGWVKSSGHYKNLINSEFQYEGLAVGLDKKQEGVFAAQVFGGN